MENLLLRDILNVALGSLHALVKRLSRSVALLLFKCKTLLTVMRTLTDFLFEPRVVLMPPNIKILPER